jgi:hypothetical protein
MTNVLDQFRAEIAQYASQDSPPARLMARLADVCAQLEASQARIEKLPLANVDRLLLGAATKALQTAAPGVERVRRWQRWSAVVAASVVCLCAVVSVWVVVWEVTRARLDEPSVVAQCADPGHQYVVKGGIACSAWVRPPPVSGS